MNGNNFGERFFSSTPLENVNETRNGPIVGTEPSVEKTPLDAALIDEWPVDEADALPAQTENLMVQEAPNGETIVYKDNMGVVEPLVDETPEAQTPAIPYPNSPAPLLDERETERFRKHWNEVQARFVDEPRTAVQEADALVTEVIGQITSMFTNEHSQLENRWKQGTDVSTEDLRMALQRYRSFFNRLVV